MMRKILPLILISIILIVSINANLQYSLSLKGDTLFINSTIFLKSDKEVNYWQINWIKPEGSEIMKIRDTLGEIKNYDTNGNEVIINTNKGERRTTEVIIISLKKRNALNYRYTPFKILEVSLPGFPEEKTEVYFKGNVVSGIASLNFKERFGNNSFYTEGYGPVNIKLLITDEKPQFKHFLIYPYYNISKADELYYIPLGIVGEEPNFPVFSILVLPDNKYDLLAEKWSEGIYKGGGLILIRESAMKKKERTATILHEVTHGFNEKFLKWDLSNESWFDEGVAKYVEFLVSRKLKIPVPEIFGEELIFEKNGKRYILKPRNTSEDLWNYYQRRENFMKYWNPSISNKRDFGYSFSEFFIRSYVLDKGFDSLHRVYEELKRINESVENPLKATELILDAMKSDFFPCYYEDKRIFEKCVERVNKFDYKIPIVRKKKINYENIEPLTSTIEKNKNNESKNSNIMEKRTTLRENVKKEKNFIEKILQSIIEFLKRLFS